MSEALSQQSLEAQRSAAMQPSIEYSLQHQQIELDTTGVPLVPHNEAVELYAINGDILATVTLPGEEQDREIAVVDYGEPDPDNPKPVFVFEGQGIPLYGYARERYGLRGLNYTPEGHMTTHVGFSDGDTIELGRNNHDRAANHDANYRLGLTNDNADTQLISRQHATLRLVNGVLTIQDHSTNGSIVRLPNPEQKDRLASAAQVHQAVGEEALSAAGVESVEAVPPQWQDTYRSLAETADRLASGTFDPSMMAGKMQQLLQSLPTSERQSLGDLQTLVDGIVNEYGQAPRYGTGDAARQIARIARSRIGK